MRDRIAEAACISHRSMNAEIITRLEHSLSHWPGQLPAFVAMPAAPSAGSGDLESFLLSRFRQLPPEKQRALLALLD